MTWLVRAALILLMLPALVMIIAEPGIKSALALLGFLFLVTVLWRLWDIQQAEKRNEIVEAPAWLERVGRLMFRIPVPVWFGAVALLSYWEWQQGKIGRALIGWLMCGYWLFRWIKSRF